MLFLLPRKTFPSCVSFEMIHNNHSLYLTSKIPRSLVFEVRFIYSRVRVMLLYLLIEEFRFHIQRYWVVSLVSRLLYSNIEGLY